MSLCDGTNVEVIPCRLSLPRCPRTSPIRAETGNPSEIVVRFSTILFTVPWKSNPTCSRGTFDDKIRLIRRKKCPETTKFVKENPRSKWSRWYRRKEMIRRRKKGPGKTGWAASSRPIAVWRSGEIIAPSPDPGILLINSSASGMKRDDPGVLRLMEENNKRRIGSVREIVAWNFAGFSRPYFHSEA